MKKLLSTLVLLSVLSIVKADVSYDTLLSLEKYKKLKKVTYSQVELYGAYFKKRPPKPKKDTPVPVTAWIKTSDSDNKPADNEEVWGYYNTQETFIHNRYELN